MKVSYRSTGRCKSRPDMDGIAIPTGWRFFYAGQNYEIPAVYLFKKGFVADIIGRIDTNAMRAFYDRYEQRGERLTPYERAQAMLEHPYQPLNSMKLWFNGEEVSGSWRADDALYMPWQAHQLPLAEEALEAYPLDKDACFSVTRLHSPYPKEQNGVIAAARRMWTRPALKSLRISISPSEQMLPLEHSFTVDLESKETPELILMHPITGTAHTLRVMDAEWQDFSAQFQKMHRMLKRRKHMRHMAGEAPGHILRIRYTLAPPLPKGERLQLQDAMPMQRQSGHSGASAIGVIGGADGPTAVFVADHDVDQRSTEYGVCYSSFYPGPQESCTINLEGVWARKEAQAEYNFVWNEKA